MRDRVADSGRRRGGTITANGVVRAERGPCFWVPGDARRSRWDSKDSSRNEAESPRCSWWREASFNGSEKAALVSQKNAPAHERACPVSALRAIVCALLFRSPSFAFEIAVMAKSTNHTAHNQAYKNHRNGIKKPKKTRYVSQKGVSWPPSIKTLTLKSRQWHKMPPLFLYPVSLVQQCSLPFPPYSLIRLYPLDPTGHPRF